MSVWALATAGHDNAAAARAVETLAEVAASARCFTCSLEVGL